MFYTYQVFFIFLFLQWDLLQTNYKKPSKLSIINEGVSYTLAPEQELVKLALTSFLDKSFYESMNDKLKRLREYCAKVDVDFLIKLATRARDKWLRTVNQVMLIEALKHPAFEKYFNKLVKRPDEIIDMLGYYAMINWQHPKQIKIANKLKRAIKSKLESFSEYQLGKYKGKQGIVNLYDLVNISHAYNTTIDKLMKWTLETPDTWEVELSKNWNSYDSWKRLIDEKKLWALAFIRNLRNIIQCGIDHKTIEAYLQELDFTMVFPFQTIQAVDMCVRDCWLSEKSDLFKALEKKIYQSFEKFATLFEWRVAVWVDISWSMNGKINNKSSLKRDKMAGYYGVCLQHFWADLYAWGTNCYEANWWSVDQFFWREVTDINALLRWVAGKWYDTLFIITDEQSSYSMWQSDIKNIIVWNIADYSHSILPSFDRWYTYITGFNDAQFEIVNDLRDLPKLVASIKLLVC